jgi:hypothetical protein
VRGRHSLVATALIVLGALLALYGVFALTWGGDSSGTTYIKIAGGEMSAHLAGGLSLALGAVLLASGFVAARGSRKGG